MSPLGSISSNVAKRRLSQKYGDDGDEKKIGIILDVCEMLFVDGKLHAFKYVQAKFPKRKFKYIVDATIWVIITKPL